MLEYFVVWIDHHEARIFEVGPSGLHSEIVEAQLFAYAKRYFHTDVQPE